MYLSGDTSVNLARSIEEAVAVGRAGAGDLLPPVREAAKRLGVSPATVATAYRLLRDRGIVVADGRRGTRIRPTMPAAIASTPLPAKVRDLASGNPDPKLLPDLERAARKLKLTKRLYGDDLNDRELLRLAAKQFDSDGVPSSEITVASGALDGIERVLREHLRPGDRVIVEDPCFTGISDLLATLALAPIPVSMDDEGLDPAALEQALRRRPSALIVTPRAQNPAGSATSERRARALRGVLRKQPGLLVIEDDHAAGVAGAEYQTLIDRTREHWAVVRSVSKSLGPDLRLALIASDATTRSRVEGRQTVGIRWVSHVLQRLAAALWRDRIVVRAERTYSERRNALIAALRAHGIDAMGASGLNVWIPVSEESSVVRELQQRNWGVQAGERYRIASAPAIRVTIATLTPVEARRFAADLATILQPGRRASAA